MELRFHLSGSTLFSTKSECIPSTGSLVRIRTQGYNKGLHAGSIIQVPVNSDNPPEFDFSGDELVVYFDADGYTVIEEGPASD